MQKVVVRIESNRPFVFAVCFGCSREGRYHLLSEDLGLGLWKGKETLPCANRIHAKGLIIQVRFWTIFWKMGTVVTTLIFYNSRQSTVGLDFLLSHIFFFDRYQHGDEKWEISKELPSRNHERSIFFTNLHQFRIISGFYGDVRFFTQGSTRISFVLRMRAG